MDKNANEPVEFYKVLDAELQEVDNRRRQRKLADPHDAMPQPAATLEEAQSKARERRLVGLAFSGGGIRSATFNLGFLQGLAGLGLLKSVDYLSTVSGGSYIGAWLAAWIRQDKKGAASVEGRLRPEQVRQAAADKGPVKRNTDPIRHLRRHSNYLAPRQGFLSMDRWVLWASYLRNFLLNQLVLLPAAVMVLLVPRILMLCYYPWVNADGYLFEASGERVRLPEWSFALFLLLALGFGTIALVCALLAVQRVRDQSVPADEAAKPVPASWQMWCVVVLLGLAACAFCLIAPYPLLSVPTCLAKVVPGEGKFGFWPSWGTPLASFMVPAALVFWLSYLFTRWWSPFSWTVHWCVLGTGLAWGGLLFGAYRLIYWFYDWDGVEPLLSAQVAGTVNMTAFGPPLVLLTVVLAITLGVGLLREAMGEELREWYASLAARLLAVSAAWVAINLIALYGTPLLLWASPSARAALGSGWFLTVAGGVLVGGSAGTGSVSPKNPLREWLARFSPPVFVAGLFLLVSLLIHVVLDNPPKFDLAGDAVWPLRNEPERPPTRITVTRTGYNGNVSVRRQKEYLRVPDEAAAIRRQYWAGLLSNDPNAVPNLTLVLDDAVINYLSSIPDMLPLEKLEPLRYKRWTAEEFETALKALDPPLPNQETSDTILRIAREKGAPPETKGQEFTFKVKELAEADIPGKVMKQLEPLQYRQWDAEPLQDQIDHLYPEAGNEQNRRLIMQTAKGQWGNIVANRWIRIWNSLLLLFACAAVLTVAAWRVDVNALSLHGVYCNRLVRAYLGAARDGTVRKPDPITGFDPDDDFLLAELQTAATKPKPYDGPYAIVNTALNLVHGKELAWQDRKAEAFALTPLYCGSETTGYRRTAGGSKGYAGGLKLGTAVTISGAAASPNMGYHSSPAVTFLLTVCNARLGAWLGNPKHQQSWKSSSPRLGFVQLFLELFGLTNEEGPYVFLSDGGHFENLGVYELVKRRCQYVVVCDAGQDENHGFEDLGNLIAKVRTDLGVRIEIAPDCLRLQKEPRHSRWHCAIGKIRYDDVDADASPGTFVYIKPSLTGDESADVLHYAASHPTFPHETTANQFYSESQFESYRALGQHIAENVFTESIADANEREGSALPAEEKGAWHRRWRREFFAALVRRWFDLPPEYEAKFVESTHGFIDVQQAFRSDPRLWQLTLDLYPELSPDGAEMRWAREATGDQALVRRTAELHVLAQMLQVMENAYLSLRLELNYAHPLNRGWMDVFHRWTSAATFRTLWPYLRGEFGSDFVRFCERQMRLGAVTGMPLPLRADQLPNGLARLLLEFEDQWPEYRAGLERGLEIAAADEATAWAIYPDNPYPGQAEHIGLAAMPVGIILVSPTPSEKTNLPPVYDLLVWLRGAYRNTGLGRPAVRTVLLQLRDRWHNPFRLRVRLPVADLTGPGGKVQRAMWLTFFHHLDFVRTGPLSAAPEDESCVELYRDFP